MSLSAYQTCQGLLRQAQEQVPSSDESSLNTTVVVNGISVAINSNSSNVDVTSFMTECISNTLEDQNAQARDDMRRWLLVITGAMVFFMQVGFAMLCAGCVRRKNVQNTMLKNMLDACGAGLAFYITGYAFAFGASESEDITFIGSSNFFNMRGGGETEFDLAVWFYEWAFASASVTIVAGTLAERCQMVAYLLYSVFLTGFVYPIIAHALWSSHGFLSAFAANPLHDIGAIDFAGSGVVHLTGGTTALVATYILGARKGRFHDSRGRLLKTPREFPGHSMALQLMGTMVLWFGWYGFNGGSALLLTATIETGKVASLAVANTTLSGAMGALTALLTNMYWKERQTGEYCFDLTMTMNGALTAMVSITAGCATVETWAALCIGTVAAWLYMAGSKLLLKLRLDDAVNAIPVHMLGGAWGLISTGLFTSPRHISLAYGTDAHVGWFFSLGRGSLDATLLLNQFLAVLFIMAWCTTCMLPFFVVLNYMGWFRTNSLEELVGLDVAYHGGKGHLLAAAAGEGGEESLAAFRKRRQEDALRKRRGGAGSGGGSASFRARDDNADDDDEDLERNAEDLSWTDMTTTTPAAAAARVARGGKAMSGPLPQKDDSRGAASTEIEEENEDEEDDEDDDDEDLDERSDNSDPRVRR